MAASATRPSARGGVMAGAALSFLALTLSAAPRTATAQEMDDVQIRATRLAEGVWVLFGRGGNIGVSAGADGIFLVDDQYAPLTPKILAALAEIDDGPIHFVLNTHWHFDHTGGNENMGGEGALLVAHEAVRMRMVTGQRIDALDVDVPPAVDGALPVLTFSDSVTFFLNRDTLDAFHVPPAHTDGDAIVHWRRANVVHMGDIFWNQVYPFIDLSSGGSVDGTINAVERALAWIGPETIVTPGHGPVSHRAGLEAYHAMLVTARSRVRALLDQGRSVDEILAAGVTAEWDDAWGNPEQLVRTIAKEAVKP